MSAGASAGASAAAAAEQQRRMREEEEEMTPYSPTELAQDWEFKIVRSAMGGFRKSAFLQQVLDDEARAGWVLVEKFDNSRIRLKRPAKARERDGKLDFDPYRTDAGVSQGTIAVAIVGAALAFVATMFLILALSH
jgi:hypothetical protein